MTDQPDPDDMYNDSLPTVTSTQRTLMLLIRKHQGETLELTRLTSQLALADLGALLRMELVVAMGDTYALTSRGGQVLDVPSSIPEVSVAQLGLLREISTGSCHPPTPSLLSDRRTQLISLGLIVTTDKGYVPTLKGWGLLGGEEERTIAAQKETEDNERAALRRELDQAQGLIRAQYEELTNLRKRDRLHPPSGDATIAGPDTALYASLFASEYVRLQGQTTRAVLPSNPVEAAEMAHRRALDALRAKRNALAAPGRPDTLREAPSPTPDPAPASEGPSSAFNTHLALDVTGLRGLASTEGILKPNMPGLWFYQLTRRKDGLGYASTWDSLLCGAQMVTLVDIPGTQRTLMYDHPLTSSAVFEPPLGPTDQQTPTIASKRDASLLEEEDIEIRWILLSVWLRC